MLINFRGNIAKRAGLKKLTGILIDFIIAGEVKNIFTTFRKAGKQTGHSTSVKVNDSVPPSGTADGSIFMQRSAIDQKYIARRQRIFFSVVDQQSIAMKGLGTKIGAEILSASEMFGRIQFRCKQLQIKQVFLCKG